MHAVTDIAYISFALDTSSISSDILPEGTSIFSLAPALAPISFLPMGDWSDILNVSGSASLEPTMLYSTSAPLAVLTFTTEPMLTTLVSTFSSSMIFACLTSSSSSFILASTLACSFLAASYSAFSERSPNDLASAIACFISSLLVFVR